MVTLTDDQALALASICDAASQLAEWVNDNFPDDPKKNALVNYTGRARDMVRKSFAIGPGMDRAQRVVSKIVEFYTVRGMDIQSVCLDDDGRAEVKVGGEHPIATFILSEFAIKTMLKEPYDVPRD